MASLSSLIRLRIAASEARRGLAQWGQSPRAEALRRHQLGLADTCSDAHLAAVLRRQALPPPAIRRWQLVWRADPATLWETDWIRFLLAGVETGDSGDGLIVVDAALTAEKADFYRQAYEAGATIVLIHLGDEWYRDDCAAYGWCNLVIRNYWTPRFAGLRHVLTVPLGCKAGFKPVRPGRPAGERAHLWCFAGDPFKTSRADMLAAMRRLGPGREHLTHGFGAAGALPVAEYCALLEDSLFVPAPCGNENLESFRVWEALEAGAIPIVERRPGLDYFAGLLGDHPLPVLERWDEAAGLVAAIRRDGSEHRRGLCQEWWAERKGTFSSVVAGALSSVDSVGLAGAFAWQNAGAEEYEGHR